MALLNQIYIKQDPKIVSQYAALGLSYDMFLQLNYKKKLKSLVNATAAQNIFIGDSKTINTGTCRRVLLKNILRNNWWQCQ